MNIEVCRANVMIMNEPDMNHRRSGALSFCISSGLKIAMIMQVPPMKILMAAVLMYLRRYDSVRSLTYLVK
jgi:hypothetical protein